MPPWQLSPEPFTAGSFPRRGERLRSLTRDLDPTVHTGVDRAGEPDLVRVGTDRQKRSLATVNPDGTPVGQCEVMGVASLVVHHEREF